MLKTYYKIKDFIVLNFLGNILPLITLSIFLAHIVFVIYYYYNAVNIEVFNFITLRTFLNVFLKILFIFITVFAVISLPIADVLKGNILFVIVQLYFLRKIYSFLLNYKWTRRNFNDENFYTWLCFKFRHKYSDEEKIEYIKTLSEKFPELHLSPENIQFILDYSPTMKLLEYRFNIVIEKLIELAEIEKVNMAIAAKKATWGSFQFLEPVANLIYEHGEFLFLVATVVFILSVKIYLDDDSISLSGTT